MAGGGFYWPAWVWFGFAVPIALNVALRWAWAKPNGFKRRDLRAGRDVRRAVGGEVLIWVIAGGRDVLADLVAHRLLVLLAVHAVIWAGSPPEREAELTERVDELTRTRRGALDVQAAELRRIERDLHDGAQARLVALSMQLGRAEERLADRPEVAELVRQARGEARAAIAELRDLARGIAPPVLADRGLAAAVEALGRRAGIPVEVDARSSARGRCRSSRPPPTSSSPRR